MIESNGNKFGTFKGVFTPSVLTILGVIMYMRFGWVLGNVGLTSTLVIVIMSTIITFLTGLSISALATNMRVGGGGAYYIISRSLGVEVGGAVGLPLFFAQTLGISFYVAGFAESITTLFPFLPYKPIAIITLILLVVIVYISAELALKVQFFIFGFIILSLISIFAGPGSSFSSEVVGPVPAKESFWVVFAVFFPAVTGILSGVSMSGDLKNPSKSLPLGTLAAVLISLVVYIAIPIFLNSKVPDGRLLRANLFILRDVAFFGGIVIIALWGAILSSAMGTLLGAPRILQALARDGVIPRGLGRGFGKNNEPHIATGISFTFGLLGVLAGDLNTLAPILSMFFLTTYGLLNLSSAFEGLIGSPSWRPKFRVHWSFSMLGAFGCFAAMFMINPGATFIALFVSFGVFYLMQLRRMKTHYGDMRYGILMLMVQYAISKLARKKPDEKTWRPNILALTGPPSSRMYLIELADAISHNRGFMTVGTVLAGKDDAQDRSVSRGLSIDKYLKKRGINALVKVHLADQVFPGMRDLIKTYGFGPIVPNTVLLGETEKREKFLEFAKLIRLAHRAKMNLVLVREGKGRALVQKSQRIDVWSAGEKQNGGLMLALAYLLTSNPDWSKARLILKTVVKNESDKASALSRLGSFLREGRLKAEAEAIVAGPSLEVFGTIRASIEGASLAFMGLRAPGENEADEEYSRYYEEMLKHTEGFPSTALVLAAENIEFQRIFQ